MHKKELIDKVAALSGLSKIATDKAINAVIKAITQCLTEGGHVLLVGFGTFYTTERAARQGRNPNTGKRISIPAKRMPRFRASKALKKAVI